MNGGKATQNSRIKKIGSMVLMTALVIFFIASCSHKPPSIPEPNLKINKITLAKGLKTINDQKIPDQPTTFFSAKDDAVVAFVEYDNLVGTHTFRWEWIDPDGMLYFDTGSLKTEAPTDNYIEHRSVWHQINIKGEKAEKLPGKWKVIIYMDDQLIAKNTFQLTSPVQSAFSDGYGLSVKENIPINSTSKLEDYRPVKINKDLNLKDSVIDDIIDFQVDVDVNIPKTAMSRPNAIAVVIGNRNYQHKDIPCVEYANRDAIIMREYLVQSLGFKPGNIIYKTDISKAGFEAIFGNFRNYKGRLNNYVKPGISEVFIFYSGHGAPDPNTQKGYFLPVDCEPDAITLNGYPLDIFYSNLSKIRAKQIVVVLDACFSGGSSPGEMIVGSASPALIKVRSSLPASSNMTVIASSKADQISSWYNEKQHGLFTYFFLKGLSGNADKNNDKTITLKEIYDYVSDQTDGVPYWARRLHGGRIQEPVLIGKNPDLVLVKY